MENPACWKTAELVIGDALEDWESIQGVVVGGSRQIAVANALRAAGLLQDSEEPEIGWDKLREHHAARHPE